MHSLRPILVLTLILAAFSAHAQTGRHFSSPSEALSRMVAAVASRDADAVASLYVADAIVLGPNSPVISGRQAIRDTWARNFANGYSALTILQQRTESGADRALTLIIWEATITPTGRPAQTVRGRSMLYIAREAEGWLFSADMWQPAP